MVIDMDDFELEIGKLYKVVVEKDDNFYHQFKVGDIVECVYLYQYPNIGDFRRDASEDYTQVLYKRHIVPYVEEKVATQALYGKEEEYTGGSSSYYKINVVSPTTLDVPYTAECNDIIEALDMSFAEGNIFKAIWRRAASRKGKQKAGHNEQYDAEKILFFAKRLNGISAE